MSSHTEAEKLKTSICPHCEGIGTVAITPVERGYPIWVCVECGATGFVDDREARSQDTSRDAG